MTSKTGGIFMFASRLAVVVVLMLSAGCRVKDWTEESTATPKPVQPVKLSLGSLCDAPVQEPLATALRRGDEESGTDNDGTRFRGCTTPLAHGRTISVDLRAHGSEARWREGIANAVADDGRDTEGGPCTEPQPVRQFTVDSALYTCTTYADKKRPQAGSAVSATVSGWFPPMVLECTVTEDSSKLTVDSRDLAHVARTLCMAERDHRTAR